MQVKTILKKKLIKIIGFSFGGFAGLIFVCCAIYVILYYPRKAESFEINNANPTKKILIATQGSDFKNSLVKILCDSLKKSSVYIKGIDLGELTEVDDKNWDRILIINALIVRLNKNVERIITSTHTPEKILMFVTSGGADWLPQSYYKVDAITSASRMTYVNDLGHLITSWLENENDQKWEPDDYVLALIFFPKVDVITACATISSERDGYMTLYPDLEYIINQVGYQYLRLKDVPSSVEVFRLNVSLFPDSWNAYDSYGEALLLNGDKESAIKNYQKALELNPNAKSARKMLKKLYDE